MKRAYVEIRAQPHYRKEAFISGLRACGFHVSEHLPSERPGPGDVMLIWNRYSDRELTADKWEKAGGTVLVAENGYIGRDEEGRQHYAIAIHGHNGSGSWTTGGPERWQALGVELQPWRQAGEHILVCPNRSFGTRLMAMPNGWEQDAVKRLRRVTKRPIRVRPHPNNQKPDRLLSDDLAGAWAVLIWASSCGVHALVAGIPVICEAPHWILKAAASGGDVENIDYPERLSHFERLAWAQWKIAEIASGEAFRHLLHPAEQGEVAASA